MKQALLATLLFTTTISFAQTKLGIQAGGLASSFRLKGEDFDNGKYKMTAGFKVGVFAEIPVSEKVFLSPELNYVFKGGKVSNDISNDAGSGRIEISTKTNYLELPLNLIYKFNGANESGFYLGAGASVGMGLSGEVITSVTGTDQGKPVDEEEHLQLKFDGKNTEDQYAHIKRFEWGANAVAGYQLNSGLGIQLQYRPNFTNLSVEKGVSYKNNYLGLNIRYRF